MTHSTLAPLHGNGAMRMPPWHMMGDVDGFVASVAGDHQLGINELEAAKDLFNVHQRDDHPTRRFVVAHRILNMGAEAWTTLRLVPDAMYREALLSAIHAAFFQAIRTTPSVHRLQILQLARDYLLAGRGGDDWAGM